jgi:hypothetical protein
VHNQIKQTPLQKALHFFTIKMIISISGIVLLVSTKRRYKEDKADSLTFHRFKTKLFGIYGPVDLSFYRKNGKVWQPWLGMAYHLQFGLNE